MIIGLTGPARSGKSTVAHILSAQGFKQVAFTDPFRTILLGLDPYVSAYMGTARLSDVVGHWGWEKCEESNEICRLLQVLSVGCRHVFGDEAMIAPVAAAIEADATGDWVVPDVRHPAEAGALRSLGASIWRVHRPAHGPQAPHDGIEADAVVDNTSSLEALAERVLGLYGLARCRELDG